MNARNEKRVMQDLGARVARSRPSSSGTRSRCTTATSSSRCTSPRTWSATSSASSRRRGCSAGTAASSSDKTRPKPAARAARPSDGRREGGEPTMQSRASRHGMSAAQDAPGGRPDPRQAVERGVRDPAVLEEDGGASRSRRRSARPWRTRAGQGAQRRRRPSTSTSCT